MLHIWQQTRDNDVYVWIHTWRRRRGGELECEHDRFDANVQRLFLNTSASLLLLLVAMSWVPSHMLCSHGCSLLLHFGSSWYHRDSSPRQHVPAAMRQCSLKGTMQHISPPTMEDLCFLMTSLSLLREDLSFVLLTTYYSAFYHTFLQSSTFIFITYSLTGWTANDCVERKKRFCCKLVVIVTLPRLQGARRTLKKNQGQ